MQSLHADRLHLRLHADNFWLHADNFRLHLRLRADTFCLLEIFDIFTYAQGIE